MLNTLNGAAGDVEDDLNSRVIEDSRAVDERSSVDLTAANNPICNSNSSGHEGIPADFTTTSFTRRQKESKKEGVIREAPAAAASASASTALRGSNREQIRFDPVSIMQKILDDEVVSA